MRKNRRLAVLLTLVVVVFLINTGYVFSDASQKISFSKKYVFYVQDKSGASYVPDDMLTIYQDTKGVFYGKNAGLYTPLSASNYWVVADSRDIQTTPHVVKVFKTNDPKKEPFIQTKFTAPDGTKYNTGNVELVQDLVQNTKNTQSFLSSEKKINPPKSKEEKKADCAAVRATVSNAGNKDKSPYKVQISGVGAAKGDESTCTCNPSTGKCSCGGYLSDNGKNTEITESSLATWDKDPIWKVTKVLNTKSAQGIVSGGKQKGWC